MKTINGETEFIHYLTKKMTLENKTLFAKDSNPNLNETLSKWQYEPLIKTVDDLWDNFKNILESHNQKTLKRPLSNREFDQVKKVISDLRTPYEAGQFLYGLNGVSQIEIDLDDGGHIYLTVFDQKETGAGNAIYQVVDQVASTLKNEEETENRDFGTTLLINGLPMIQIEEKKEAPHIDDILSQFRQDIDENKYCTIFSTVQILIGITVDDVKYMANTTIEKFNKNFAFNWQRRADHSIVTDWKEFSDIVLSIPMAYQMVTNYMILDGTKNRQALKVMRPYQVYATQNVLEGIQKANFEEGRQKIGFVWHTTGSGKTITSFKTAWLANRMPQVDKVVFVVDRVALTNQISENYRAYDPDGTGQDILRLGIVRETKNTQDLNRKLTDKDNDIVITSVQKLDLLIKQKNFVSPDKNIVFIVDDAHRSTGGAGFSAVQKAFKKGAWIGYTGTTPMFDEATTGRRTEDIFGKLLHAYTIREAIADKNVLGFKVDFISTINEEKAKQEYLTRFYKAHHPKWSTEKIQEQIEKVLLEDTENKMTASIYDQNSEHIQFVVQDIFKNWRSRSNDNQYNALFTTHVAEGKSSIPMLMQYFREFQKMNTLNRKSGHQPLKVAAMFSLNTSTYEMEIETRQGLQEVMKNYNREFGTNFDVENVAGYTQDVTSRLNRTATDGKFLDLVIVVDQLLTGFDHPELNTIYIDRMLKGANLIQAYSRTNRIENMQEKPWGRVVNYRWPKQNKEIMRETFAIYANIDTTDVSKQALQNLIQEAGIIAAPYGKVFNKMKRIVAQLAEITQNFQYLPTSEMQQEKLLVIFREYSEGMAKLKQFGITKFEGTTTGFDYDYPEKLLKTLNMSLSQERNLTTVLTNKLKQQVARKKNIPFYQIELDMTHVSTVEIDYEYLTTLLENLLNQVHTRQNEEALKTKEKIDRFAIGLDDRSTASKIDNTVKAIVEGYYRSDHYPVRLHECHSIIREANRVSLNQYFHEFRTEWGINQVISSEAMQELFNTHQYKKQDLDNMGQLSEIIAKASMYHKTLPKNDQIQKLSKIKYRNKLRKALYELADEIVLEQI